MTRDRARALVHEHSAELRRVASEAPGAVLVLVAPEGLPVEVLPLSPRALPVGAPLDVRRAVSSPPGGPWRWVMVASGATCTDALAVPVTWPTSAPLVRGAA